MKNELVVSVVDLPAEIGAHQSKEIVWTVPESWRTEVLELPVGTEIPLDVALTSIDEGILVQVRGEGELVGQCVRCLDEVRVPWKADAADIYVEAGRPRPAGKDPESDGDIESEGDELDPVKTIDRATVNLEPLLRDAIFGGAPLRPLCKADCEGLCAHCGVRLEDAEPGHKHEFLDPRFAALEGFFDEQPGADE